MIRLVIGCNYHTAWQSHPGMRFVLESLSEDGKTATLKTRKTCKIFTTKVEDLIFIESDHNIRKANRLEDKA